MKKRQRQKAGTAIGWRLAAALAIVSFAVLFLFTYHVKSYYDNSLLEENDDIREAYMTASGLSGSYFSQRYDENMFHQEQESPGTVEYSIFKCLEYYNDRNVGKYHIFNKNLSDSYFYTPLQTAVVFYDKEGNVIHESGDYLVFYYQLEEALKEPEEGIGHLGWIDLNEIGITKMKDDIHTDLLVGVLRIRGYIEGTKIIPTEIKYTNNFDYAGWLREDYDKYGYTDEQALVELDRLGAIEWNYLYERGTEADEVKSGSSEVKTRGNNEFSQKHLESETKIVTLYADAEICTFYEEGDSLSINENTSDKSGYTNEKSEKTVKNSGDKGTTSLLELLKIKKENIENDPSSHQYYFYDGNQDGKGNYIVFHREKFYPLSAEELHSRDYEQWPEPEITMLTAVTTNSWIAAIAALKKVYLWCFLLIALLWICVMKSIRKRLILPMEAVNQGIEKGYTHLQIKESDPVVWKEGEELRNNYKKTQVLLQDKKNEIIRLETALGFAKKAEENRRQMTSNIAHELKTPLAIIHSYTEGLQEHIAEEKKEEYYNIIFSEVERMDSMVLEMLDLSRLEAGRVKLSIDEFSLTKMTETIFDTMDNLIQKKNLKIRMNLPEACIIQADEGRIYQVMLNFVSNAVRYTPEKGEIQVEISTEKGMVHFRIKNDVERSFTKDELYKIWDTFYKTDQSRNGKGTGLGLAIAKNIVELHGGRCVARNCRSGRGVEFAFALPVSLAD